MGKIVSKFEGRGGVIDIDTLTRNPPKPPVPPKTTVESITETIERIITMPSMQPILEQAGHLLGAYAEKLMRENAVKQNASGPGSMQQLPSPTPVFGAGGGTGTVNPSLEQRTTPWSCDGEGSKNP